jgi:outer membrane translocation and assembly module TamA
VGYIRDLGGLPPFFGDRLYAAGFFEAGRLFSDLNPDSLLQDFALAFGTRSPLGAVWLGGAWGEGAEAKVFFRIGRLF